MSDDELGILIAASTSMSEVLRRMGRRPSGSTHQHFTRRARSMGADMSHFVRGTQGHPSNRKKTPEIVLVKSQPGTRRVRRYQLVRALEEIGVSASCAQCGLTDAWNGKPLRLELHHVNGNNADNRRENLLFLCPNCHSQTDSYGFTGKIVKKNRERCESQV